LVKEIGNGIAKGVRDEDELATVALERVNIEVAPQPIPRAPRRAGHLAAPS
jgi:hypothetical protein